MGETGNQNDGKKYSFLQTKKIQVPKPSRARLNRTKKTPAADATELKPKDNKMLMSNELDKQRKLMAGHVRRLVNEMITK